MQQINPPGKLVRAGAIFLSGCGVVLLIGGALMGFNQAFPSCTNEILNEIPSPGGKFKAVLFRRSCASTDSVTTNVSIFGISEKLPNQPGNSFIAQGITPLGIRWINGSELLIDEPKGINVTLRVAKYCDIQIRDH
jgi:hypothetical protein